MTRTNKIYTNITEAKTVDNVTIKCTDEIIRISVEGGKEVALITMRDMTILIDTSLRSRVIGSKGVFDRVKEQKFTKESYIDIYSNDIRLSILYLDWVTGLFIKETYDGIALVYNTVD